MMEIFVIRFSFKYLVLIFVSALVAISSNANPKSLVELSPSEDRWITFADGGKLHFGFEIPYMIAAYLYNTGDYITNIPIQQGGYNSGIRSFSSTTATSTQSIINILKTRAPDIDWEFLKNTPRTKVSLPNVIGGQSGFRSFGAGENNQASEYLLPRIKIRSRLETLLYASGNKSNRVVLGFTPERLNAFNAGMVGSEDNEFVLSPGSEKQPECRVVDFFDGQLKVEGFGPSMPNFGADSDEGFAIHLFGYGFGFKKKSFELKSEVVVEVEIAHLNFKKEYRYSLKGGGRDLFIAGSYSGVSVGVEVQRRETLRKALQKMFPELLHDFQSQLPKHTWQTQILGEYNGQWMIAGDQSGGIIEGLELISNLGSKYRVTYASSFEGYAFIVPSDQNTFSPFTGELLRLDDNSDTVWQTENTQLRDLATKTREFEQKNPEVVHIEKSGLNLNESGVNKAVEIVNNLNDQSVPAQCLEKKMGYWERLLAAFSYLYGLYRYNDVLDQRFDKLVQTNSRNSNQLKIAVVSSGISPKEKSLEKHLEGSGFDFYSWDNRPSDDFGAGTAAALLLKKKLDKDFTLVPYKVFGAYGETNSSAIYSAFQHIANRQDINAVIVPFKPNINSKAYTQGIELVVEAGKKVFIPEGVNIKGAITSPASSKQFKTKALESKVLLSPIGVGVIEKAASDLK